MINFQRQGKFNARAAPGMLVNSIVPPDLLHAPAHVVQAVAGTVDGGDAEEPQPLSSIAITAKFEDVTAKRSSHLGGPRRV